MAEPDDEAARNWYDRKSELMEQSLGPAHGTVMHSIIPYPVGGLDLYYYPLVPDTAGTAIATKELSELPDQGSSNEFYRSYELVMFTRHALDLDSADDLDTAFGRIHRTINAILDCIAPYSAEATLNPRETCEFPEDMKAVGGRCLIFDGYTPHSEDQVQPFGLLAVIEVFRSEMDFARENGGAALIARLKEKGAYPYSDLDRDPVA
jgi:hypothetical protein